MEEYSRILKKAVLDKLKLEDQFEINNVDHSSVITYFVPKFARLLRTAGSPSFLVCIEKIGNWSSLGMRLMWQTLRYLYTPLFSCVPGHVQCHLLTLSSVSITNFSSLKITFKLEWTFRKWTYIYSSSSNLTHLPILPLAALESRPPERIHLMVDKRGLETEWVGKAQ